jgi:hypothetical protein
LPWVKGLVNKGVYSKREMQGLFFNWKQGQDRWV